MSIVCIFKSVQIIKCAGNRINDDDNRDKLQMDYKMTFRYQYLGLILLLYAYNNDSYWGKLDKLYYISAMICIKFHCEIRWFPSKWGQYVALFKGKHALLVKNNLRQ